MGRHRLVKGVVLFFFLILLFSVFSFLSLLNYHGRVRLELASVKKSRGIVDKVSAIEDWERRLNDLVLTYKQNNVPDILTIQHNKEPIFNKNKVTSNNKYQGDKHAAFASSSSSSAWNPSEKIIKYQRETQSESTAGVLNVHIWEAWCGSRIEDLKRNEAFPLYPNVKTNLTRFFAQWFETGYGERIFGYIHPPETGNYTFAVSCDDNCEVWLSNSSDPRFLKKIVSVGSFSSPANTKVADFRQEINQISVEIYLKLGDKYYIEALHKQAANKDHVLLTWLAPSWPRVKTISSDYISSFITENERMEDVNEYASHIPITESCQQAHDVYNESSIYFFNSSQYKFGTKDDRTDFHRLPLVDDKDFANVLQTIEYVPSYIVDFTPRRYEGVKLIHEVSVFPDDFTELTHMLKYERCEAHRLYDSHLNTLRPDVESSLFSDSDWLHSGRFTDDELKRKSLSNSTDSDDIRITTAVPDHFDRKYSQKKFGSSLNARITLNTFHIDNKEEPARTGSSKAVKNVLNDENALKAAAEESENSLKQQTTMKHQSTGSSRNSIVSSFDSYSNRKLFDFYKDKNQSIYKEFIYKKRNLLFYTKSKKFRPGNDTLSLLKSKMDVDNTNAEILWKTFLPTNNIFIKKRERLDANTAIVITALQKESAPLNAPQKSYFKPPFHMATNLSKQINESQSDGNSSSWSRGSQHRKSYIEVPRYPKATVYSKSGVTVYGRPKENGVPAFEISSKMNAYVTSVDERRNTIPPYVADDQLPSNQAENNLRKRPLKIPIPLSSALQILQDKLAVRNKRKAAFVSPRESSSEPFRTSFYRYQYRISPPLKNKIYFRNGVPSDEKIDLQYNKHMIWMYDIFGPAVYYLMRKPNRYRAWVYNSLLSECKSDGNPRLSVQVAKSIVYKFMRVVEKLHGKKYTLTRIVNVEENHDVINGNRYLLELIFKVQGQDHPVAFSKYVFENLASDKLYYPAGFQWDPHTTVHIIVPVKNQGSWVQHFINNMEQIFLETNDKELNIIIVDFESSDINITQSLQDSKLKRYELVKLTGPFQRALGLQAGADTIKNGKDIIFMCDLHLVIPTNLITNIRKHTIHQKMAFAPMVHRLSCGYTPELPYGLWEIQGYGLFSITKHDYLRIGGMNTKEFKTKWGGEDWEFLDRTLAHGLEVTRLRVPHFFHYYHSKKRMWVAPNMNKSAVVRDSGYKL